MDETIDKLNELNTNDSNNDEKEQEQQKDTVTENDNNNNNNDDDDVDRSKDKEKLKEISLKDKYKTNQDDLTEANNLKTFGNRAYTDKDYDSAIKYYNDAISLLKKEDIDVVDGGDSNSGGISSTKKIIEIKEIDQEKDIINCSEELAVLYSNRSACYLITAKHELVLADCTTALQYEPTPSNIRVKIYHRRAQAREALDKPREALEDYQEIIKMDPKFPQAQQALKRLPPIIKAKEEKEREEMMGKLKDLGNTILGKFGLSTDNFQFVKDPSSGGYSVNFKK